MNQPEILTPDFLSVLEILPNANYSSMVEMADSHIQWPQSDTTKWRVVQEWDTGKFRCAPENAKEAVNLVGCYIRVDGRVWIVKQVSVSRYGDVTLYADSVPF